MKEAKIPTDLDPVYMHFKYTRPDDCRIVHELRLLVLQGMTPARSPAPILKMPFNGLARILGVKHKRLRSVLDSLSVLNEIELTLIENEVSLRFVNLPYGYAYRDDSRASDAQNSPDPDPDPIRSYEVRSDPGESGLRKIIDDTDWEGLAGVVGQLAKHARPGLSEVHVIGYIRQAEKEAKTTKQKALMHWLSGCARPDRPKDKYLRDTVPNHSDSSPPVAKNGNGKNRLPVHLQKQSEAIMAHYRKISGD